MGTAFFIYDLLIILLCTVAMSLAVCAYFVCHRRSLLSVATFFVAYVLEVSLIFQDEYTGAKPDVSVEVMDFPMTHPWIKLVVSVVLVGSALCYVLQVSRRLTTRRLALSVGSLAAVSCCVLLFSPSDNARQLLFYDIRQLYVIAACVLLLHDMRSSEGGSSPLAHLHRPKRLVWAVVALSVLVIVEDLSRLALRIPGLGTELIFYLQGRNFSENVLVVLLALAAIQSSGLTLSLRFQEPPTVDENDVRQAAEVRFARFCEDAGLTTREREILTEVLAGKDNRQIAQELYISVGTVKSHVHSVFKKCGVTSRKELLQTFWQS